MLSWFRKRVCARYDARLLSYFVVVGFVPILFLCLIVQRVSYKMAQRQMELQTENTVMNVSVALSNTIQRYEEMLEALSKDKEVLAFVQEGFESGESSANHSLRTSKALYKLYGTVSGETEYLAAHIVSSGKRAGVSTEEEIPLNYFYPFNNGWGIFQRAEEAEACALRTNDYNPNALPGVSFSMASAVRDEAGEVQGYIVFDIYAHVFDQVLSEIELSNNLEIYLSDSYDFLIYATKAKVRNHLDTLPQSLRLKRRETISSGYALLEDSEKYVAALGMEKYGIRVTGEMPMELAVQTGRYVWRAAVLCGSIGMILSIFFAFLAWKGVSAPLHQLMQVFGEVQRGDLSARVDMHGRGDEFGKLGNNFNNMADQIETLIKNVEEKQRCLRVAESSALQAQINPHFLYNTLDLIKWNSKLQRNEEVTKITVMLGRLLRSMANFEHDTVTVEEECEIINDYLGIQSIHYGDRLVIEQSIPPEVYELQIPKFILQPIIENAVVHGIAEQRETCILRLCAEYEAPYLVFQIEDNGAGIPPEKLEQLFSSQNMGNIGLKNVDRRARLYGDERCGIEIRSTLRVGTCVRLCLRAL